MNALIIVAIAIAILMLQLQIQDIKGNNTIINLDLTELLNNCKTKEEVEEIREKLKEGIDNLVDEKLKSR